MPAGSESLINPYCGVNSLSAWLPVLRLERPSKPFRSPLFMLCQMQRNGLFRGVLFPC